MAEKAKAPYRPMKFPYTHTARIVQFPYRHYFNTGWFYRYYAISVVLCAPLFWKLQVFSHNENNVQLWEEKRRKEMEEAHH